MRPRTMRDTRTPRPPAAVPVIAPAEARVADLAAHFAARGLRLVCRARVGLTLAPIVRLPKASA